jgi:hypothetical protein
MNEIDNLLAAIRRRFEEIDTQGSLREIFVAHLESLACWYDNKREFPDPGEVAFPEMMPIAFAVCHSACGTGEFIVDGSTQECQHCGSLMFRTKVATYRRSA